jgi:single-stranded-DNA-specific exonuclease
VLLSGGGHAQAAGARVHRDNLSTFSLAFTDACSRATFAGPTLDAYPMKLAALDRAFIDRLATLAPHGAGNPEPVFMASAVEPIMQRRLSGGAHLKFTAVQGNNGHPAIWFNAPDLPPGLIDIAFRPGLNHWNGTTSVQLVIVDARPHVPETA